MKLNLSLKTGEESPIMIPAKMLRSLGRENPSNSSFIATILILILLCLPVVCGAKGLDAVIYKERNYGYGQKGLWGVTVRFNKSVFPSDLEKSLKVTSDGKSVPVGLADPKTGLTAEKAMRTFRVVPKDRKLRDKQIELRLEKGLADSSGRWTLSDDRTMTFWALDPIRIRNLTTFYKNKNNYGLNFQLVGRSSQVTEEELKKAITIKPDVGPITLEKKPHGRWSIKAEFEKSQKYTFKTKSIPVADGRSILEEAKHVFTGPGVDSLVAFRTDKSIIELKGRQLLPINLTNVTKLRCSLTRIPGYFAPEVFDSQKVTKINNPLRPGNEPSTQYEVGADLKKIKGDLETLKKETDLPASFAGEMVDDATVYFAKSQGGNKVFGYSAALTFRPEPEKGGTWLVELKDLDSNYKETVKKLVQITDLSISYKLSSEQLLVWVTSIHTGEPVKGVEVMLKQSNGLALLLGKSDENGLIVVKNGDQAKNVSLPSKNTKNMKPLVELNKAQWLVAATENDSALTRLDKNRLKPFSIKQSSKITEPYESESGYVFTERGVYKPGESVHFKFMQRTYKDGEIKSPKGAKIDIEITDPRGEILYSKKLELNEFGGCHDTFDLKEFYKTGTYLIKAVNTASVGKRKSWTKDFLVAEYKRPRHFVEMSMERITSPAEDYIGVSFQEDLLKVKIEGKYYAGGPVKNANTRWKATLKPVKHDAADFSGFHFGNDQTKTMFLESGEATLDENGVLELAIPMDTRLLSGLYGVEISSTVLDIDGEPATTVKTFKPKPKYLIGISNHPKAIPRDYTENLKVIVVDKDGNRVQSGKITTIIMKNEYFYMHKRDSQGNINYQWEQGWQKELSYDSPIENGAAQIKVNFSGYQDYMIRCEYTDDSEVYASQTSFDVGWNRYESWISTLSKDGVPTTDAIFLSMSAKEYKVGDTVNVEFETKRPVKKCLVTIEGRSLMSHQVIDVNGTRGSISFTVAEDHLPNAFISVIAAAPRGNYPVYQVQTDQDVPSVYFGYAKFGVKRKLPKLKVTLDNEGKELKGRPGESKKITFKVTDHKDKGVRSEMTVCVVDEAVLALTRFTVPDLKKLADFSLPLGVFSGDLRLSLISQDLYKIFSTKPLTGGGAGAGYISSTIRKDFRPVAYFNPALVTDDQGNASIEFDLPDTTTAYRVYVVAADTGSGFASSQWNMVVNKEFFIEPALPRFLISGDKLIFPIALHNRSDQAGDVTIEAESSENLKLKLKSPEVKIEPWQSGKTMAEADLSGGVEAMFRFNGVMNTGDGPFGDIIEKKLPVESKYLAIHRSLWGSFSKKGKIKPKFQEGVSVNEYRSLHPADLSANLTLSLTNWNRIAPGLKYLLRYPYGCVEQTSSGLIPLAAMRALVEQGKIPGVDTGKVDKFINKGVNRLLSMQGPTGGFAYWPGELNPSWWGSMYATAALTLLKDSGYEVPTVRMDNALEYLREGLFNDVSKDKYHGGEWIRELSLFNLAMNDKLKPDELEKVVSNYDDLSTQGKAFVILAGTRVNKDVNSKKSPVLGKGILKKLLMDLKPELDGRGKKSFRYSTYREVAICTLAGIEAGVDPEVLDKWAGYLLKEMKSDGRWLSTADTGWCLLALARYFQTKGTSDESKVVCKIEIPGGETLEKEVGASSLSLKLDPKKLISGEPVNISTNSKKLVNYTLNLKYPDLVNDPDKLKQGFSLRKSIENLNGKDEIRVGDILRITLDFEIDDSLENDRRRVEYVALEDPVPAGITPINRDLKTEGATAAPEEKESRTSWRDPRNFNPDHSEFLDDRIRIFKDKAWGGFYRYSYLARAVAQGEFWMRGSRISLMYDPDSFGKTTGKMMKILPGN